MIEIVEGIKEEHVRIDGKLFATYYRNKKIVLFHETTFCLTITEIETLTNWLIALQLN